MNKNKIKHVSMSFYGLNFYLIMGILLVSVFPVKLQAAALEEELASLAAQESTLALPGLPAPEAPAMPYPYSVEGLAQEQKNREERYALQKQLRREEVQKRREQRGAIQEEEFKEGQEGRTQALLCFLDDSEIHWNYKENNGVTQQLMAAMVVEVGPLVVSGSLLAHIFNERGNHSYYMKALVQEFYNRFDSRRWIVKEVTSDLFLLVPIKDFSDNEIKQLEVSGLSSGETSDLEYRLGIRVNHMSTIEFALADKYGIQDYFKKSHSQYIRKTFSSSSLKFVMKVLQNSLFMSLDNKEKEVVFDHLLPEMVIYLVGHGSYGRTIANISIDTTNKLGKSLFQRILDYFATRIKTKLVVIDSCYAAGFNAQKILSEIKEGGSTSIYPFHLLLLATGDMPTSLAQFAVDVDLKPTMFFNIFIQEAKRNLYDFNVIKRIALSLITSLKVDIIPQWRPAKSALWIPVFEDDKAVIRIGSVMAKARKEPLFITPYKDAQGEMQDPKVLLLAAEEIPFSVEIDHAIKKIPAFVSVFPGKVTHRIKKLIYTGGKFNVSDFFGAIQYGVSKTFIIDELVIIKDGQQVIFTEVLIEKKGKEVTAFGKQNGVWHNLNTFE